MFININDYILNKVRMMQKNETSLRINIDINLKKDVQAYCVFNSTTLKSLVTELLKKKLKEK